MRAEELKAKHERKSQSGLMFMLLVAFMAAEMGAGYTFYHVLAGTEQAADFGMELSAAALFYDKFVAFGFIVPVLIWGAALVVTKAGKTQRNIGTMLAILLFAFSVLWPAGAFVAFMDAYNPPRTDRAPTQQTIPE